MAAIMMFAMTLNTVSDLSVWHGDAFGVVRPDGQEVVRASECQRSW